jgi:cysteine dioxygenase
MTHSRFLRMEEFLERMHDFARKKFDCAEVMPFLGSTLIAPESLAPYLHWAPGGYSRNLVHRDQSFELMALCWDVGQCSKVHGHEGEKCWARVEQGKLRFRNYAETGPRQNGRARLVQTGSIVDGEPGHVDGPADIHSVGNPAEFGGRAVSLHLYCYPFDECEIFDLETGEVSRLRLTYDSVGGKSVKAEPGA